MWPIMKLLNIIGYLAIYITIYWVVVLHCIALPLLLCCLYDVPLYSIFPPTFNNYTSGQSVSSVLLWQPSNCIDLFVIDYCLLFLENKYDDDDDNESQSTKLLYTGPGY